MHKNKVEMTVVELKILSLQEWLSRKMLGYPFETSVTEQAGQMHGLLYSAATVLHTPCVPAHWGM